MKFGVREICNVVFRAKADQKIGNMEVKATQPVLYIDSATASNLEQASTTVYANGGRGNARLIAWDGEKTLTFTVTDALMSPMGLAILSGAGLFKGQNYRNQGKLGVHVHVTGDAIVDKDGNLDLSYVVGKDVLDEDAPMFVMGVEADGSLNGKLYDVSIEDGKATIDLGEDKISIVKVDCYVMKSAAAVDELVIDAGHFAGNYYVEAETLFRKQSTGKDMPAVITLPNVKIQSNFTFAMASNGDPSTFDFTMDALPGYTYFNNAQKVMCAIQIIDDEIESASLESVMDGVGVHPEDFEEEISQEYGDALPDTDENVKDKLTDTKEEQNGSTI